MTPRAPAVEQPQRDDRRRTNACAVCAQPIGHGWLMCQTHWRTVPGPLQRDVTRSWGRFERNDHGDRAKNLHEYRTARDAAITAACAANQPQAPAADAPLFGDSL